MGNEELKIIHLYDRQDPEIQVKLEKNSKGYNWEITFKGEDADAVLAKIREVNKKLNEEYGGER